MDILADTDFPTTCIGIALAHLVSRTPNGRVFYRLHFDLPDGPVQSCSEEIWLSGSLKTT